MSTFEDCQSNLITKWLAFGQAPLPQEIGMTAHQLDWELCNAARAPDLNDLVDLMQSLFGVDFRLYPAFSLYTCQVKTAQHFCQGLAAALLKKTVHKNDPDFGRGYDIGQAVLQGQIQWQDRKIHYSSEKLKAKVLECPKAEAVPSLADHAVAPVRRSPRNKRQSRKSSPYAKRQNNLCIRKK